MLKQTIDVLNIAKELFEEANTDKENILRARIYLKDIDRILQTSMKSGTIGFLKKIHQQELVCKLVCQHLKLWWNNFTNVKK